jgi:hypothetical protein
MDGDRGSPLSCARPDLRRAGGRSIRDAAPASSRRQRRAPPPVGHRAVARRRGITDGAPVHSVPLEKR